MCPWYFKPHGALSWTEGLLRGPGGPPYYPLPWARNPDISFLVSEAELATEQWNEWDFASVKWIDETEAMRTVFEQGGRTPQQSASAQPLTRPSGAMISPSGFKNVSRSMMEQRVVPIFAIAERA